MWGLQLGTEKAQQAMLYPTLAPDHSERIFKKIDYEIILSVR